MQALNFYTNPFYLLEVSPKDKRTAIISKAEEKAFFLEDGSCESAQATLLNPSKRLLAELDWFPDVDEKKVEKICKCIAESKAISTECLSPISKINALLFNFSIMQNIEAYDIGFMLVDIDEQFGLITIDSALEMVNACRKEAGMRIVTETEIDEAIDAKRDAIRQIFTEKLHALSDEEYMAFVSILAKQYVANDDYDDGIIISDALDQYEIRMQTEIQKHTEAVEKQIEYIKGLSDKEAIEENVRGLIEIVEAWDVYVQPLQVRSQASGMPHGNSFSLGREIRNLALYLHNEKELTEIAFDLVIAMKYIFEEDGDLAERFEDDAETLGDIISHNGMLENFTREMEFLKSVANTLTCRVGYSVVDLIINTVQSLNSTVKQLELDVDLAKNVRVSICLTAREAAIKLHNERQQTSDALEIVMVLVSEFGDIQEIRERLIRDKVTLQQQRTQQLFQRPASSGGCYIATCVYGSYDCPQVWTLRRYRDTTLGATWYGRLFIRLYYFVSPVLVKLFGKTNWFKKLWKRRLDKMINSLEKQGFENTPYFDKEWK